MSVSLLLTSITDAISQLSISGVTIRDYDGITGSWKSTANVLYPNPEGFITNFSVTYPTVLRGAAAPADVRYTLNYRFLGTQLGDIGGMAKAYADMVDKVALVAAKMIETDAPYSGRVEMQLAGVTIGARTDPAGNVYHGADIALNVMEMQNP